MPSERRYVDPASGEVVENPTIRPFSEVLAELGEGTTHAELSEAFWELLCRVQETGADARALAEWLTSAVTREA